MSHPTAYLTRQGRAWKRVGFKPGAETFESSISEAKEFHQKIAGSYQPHTYVYYDSKDKPQPRVHHLENDAWGKRQQAPRFTPRKLWDATLKSVHMRYGAVAPKPDPWANIRGPRAEEVAGSERILDGIAASFAQREPCPWTGR
ncbi:hypothetical protein NTD80_16875 [Pseudomonas sp. 13B_2.1_Bac1]|uniref:hypothetical protein n=1 Tax=Pseudomonas sp. 13B_2.1_Bac1 TaxID=2971624 RepID=UPI0021C5906A|nr:hypothetical protein [Pseudomonas sp. 13B_2.1_Bac1]MCU1784428.1 hypothetical protein [Pseudomonas sp. 13B_2.1_Bac1]